MRSLFDDTKNPVFRLLCQIVNEIGAGAKLTRRDILNRIFELPEFIYLEAPESLREENLVDTLFTFSRDGFAVVPTVKNFSLPMSDTELCWLSAIFAADENAFLLPTPLREKLSARLKNFPPLYDETFWRKIRPGKPSEPAGKIFSDKLSVAVEALRLRKKIACGNEIFTPCRLEYDLFADKFFLIVLREETQAVEKIPVDTMSAPRLTTESAAPDAEELLEKFYAEHVAEVTIKIRNTRNAVERCFALLSSFDKKARLQDDGTYFLTVKYCTFDEAEVFEKIFSLGATVEVVAPKSFRERVIRKFSAIKALYD
ncbi:MAG: WYL domain-containing protein [Selenomonadaceae bacterium]|nr:WYL domain-containing protein [Selenomonadaceae bacterium]